MRPFWLYFETSAVAFAVCLVLIGLSNLRRLRRLDRYPPSPATPRVSVLVPARNEEANIGACVTSLLAQDYPDLEVVVLNDHSTDRTGEILAGLTGAAARAAPTRMDEKVAGVDVDLTGAVAGAGADPTGAAADPTGAAARAAPTRMGGAVAGGDADSTKDERVRVLEGRDLPEGWLGKHWACHQLAEAASGELLLFTDADTRHGPASVRHGVAALHAEGADLLTALPFEETVTLAEQLIVPVIPWSILTFLPLEVAYRTRSPAFSATIGQYMLFRANAYRAIGGHAAIATDPVDDISLGRRIKGGGFRWRLADATGDVRCRMYQNAEQVFEGFSKNLFSAFGNRALPFVGVWLWLEIVFLLPVAVLLARLLGAPVPNLDAGIALAGVAAGLASWGVSHLRFGFPARLIPLYPLTMLLALTIALRSVALVRRGRTTWKGRTLVQRPVRWW